MIPMNVRTLMVSLRGLCDVEFQRRVWLRGEGPEVSTFPETIAQTFDDTGLGLAMEKERDLPGVDAETLSVLKNLRQLTSAIDQYMDTEKLLEHPQMQELRNRARTALRLLELQYWGPSELPRPSFEEVASRIEGLISGQLSREEVADWAVHCFGVHDSRSNEKNLWLVLDSIADVDATEPGGDYIFSLDDIRKSLDELRGR